MTVETIEDTVSGETIEEAIEIEVMEEIEIEATEETDITGKTGLNKLHFRYWKQFNTLGL